MDSPDRAIADIAMEQHGTFTAAQADACGLGRRAIDLRVERGLLIRLHPSVYGWAGTPETQHRRLMAAVLSVGRGAAASHRTAAELWEMTAPRARDVDVITTRWDRVRRDGVTVHESRDLIPDDIVAVGGIPITAAARTVVDLGASEGPWLVAACLDAGLRRKLFTIGQVDAFVARVARKGRRGVGVIRPLLAERAGWDGSTESELEDRFRRLVTGAGLSIPVGQYVLRDHDGLFVCRADFAYPERRVLIELDSEAFHMDREVFRADRSKQNEALALGWSTLRFTWYDVTQRPAAVLRVLADI